MVLEIVGLQEIEFFNTYFHFSSFLSLATHLARH